MAAYFYGVDKANHHGIDRTMAEHHQNSFSVVEMEILDFLKVIT